MAKTTSKRKSKGSPVEAIRDVKRKRSTAKATAGKAHETSDEDSAGNDSIIVAERVAYTTLPMNAAGGKKTKSGRVYQSEEYEEDPGRIESQQFLNLARIASENKASGKSQKYLEEFKTTVEEHRDELISIRDNQDSQFTAYDVVFNESFRTAYSVLLAPEDGKETSLLSLNPGKDTHKLYHKSSNVIKSAMNILEQFQMSVAGVASHKAMISAGTNWEAEVNQTTHILEIGREAGRRMVDGILGVHEDGETDGDAVEVSKLLFEKVRNCSAELTWANVARKQEKAVKKLARVLPEE